MQKKFEVGNYVSVYVDLYDESSGRAFMFDKPIRANDHRESAFLQETAKLRPQSTTLDDLYRIAQVPIIDRYLLESWHKVKLDLLDHETVAELYKRSTAA